MERNKHLELIDYLKGYSITMIVLYHLSQIYDLNNISKIASNFGGAGVHVFILCSGYGLYLSQLYKPLSYFDFLKKRFFKVYTPFLFIVLISAIFPFMYNGEDRLIALLSNVFLFKMFSEQFINSFGKQLWFVSMIIQFYLMFPLIVKCFKIEKPWLCLILALIISLSWATLVGFLGRSEYRIYNSFFLQYLWEFVLGMVLANYYYHNLEIKIPKKTTLLFVSIIGVILTGIMGLKGGWWKLYNDIPSLIGYIAFALWIYTLRINFINYFFKVTSEISYEWYLIHILVFNCMFYYLDNHLNMIIIGLSSLLLSYLLARLYQEVLKKYIHHQI